MLFNSYAFLLFFPLVTLVYFLIPFKVRWIWLLAASYYFYMGWNAKYALLIASSTVVTYLSGILIARDSRIADEKKRNFRRKLWVFLSFSINLAILFFFKYFHFALDNINRVLGFLHIGALRPQFDVLLPVGISFFTFQALGYTVDVYRGDLEAERHLGKYALFVSFFPQLVAGPIERSGNLLSQVYEKHPFNYDRVRNGLLLMLWGYFQKVVVADRVSVVVSTIFNDPGSYPGLYVVVGAALFAVQILCDFSAYTDIAIGAAQVMGFRLMDNFHRPYFATSIRDFWRRWHISLSTWFRDYLYIPLGGSRCGRLKRYRNILITFVASGLWHGASWNYVVWGALHGCYQIFGDWVKPARDKLYALLHVRTKAASFRFGRILCTFILVNVGWVFFRASSLRTALRMLKSVLTQLNPWILVDGSLYKLGLNELDFRIMLMSIAVLLGVHLLQSRMRIRERLAEQNLPFRWALYLGCIFVVLIFGVYGPGYDASQFIYFQF